MKYVVFDSLRFVIFPDFVSHDTFAHLKPTSAGYVKFSTEIDEWGEEAIIANCYGDSFSLKIESKKEEDNRVLNTGLRLK